MKTASVVLVLCLNLGIDPPDVVKPDPCARLECWHDPKAIGPTRALDLIGRALQAQYEGWQPTARYRTVTDPTFEDVRKACLALRRNAKDERVLFHYNGHGVPRPTANGELWLFNRNITQYIPLSLYDLQEWMGAPAIYVFDCSAAGLCIPAFLQFAEQREREMRWATHVHTGAGAPGGGGAPPRGHEGADARAAAAVAAAAAAAASAAAAAGAAAGGAGGAGVAGGAAGGPSRRPPGDRPGRRPAGEGGGRRPAAGSSRAAFPPGADPGTYAGHGAPPPGVAPSSYPPPPTSSNASCWLPAAPTSCSLPPRSCRPTSLHRA
ncbi:hypothetical protein BU14_0056s0029 [Porphyra umbilicalis]|uniref:Raptor N-terminal CASPase-like domain-containing protein n=1 Tax=Porphyra umbilicalis TaxID=2786 RepID=A0A1X6PHN4_PORUM|nr:hypothetical protein BU14_0056s0029 [Porphyra umbilicalis]|eukprot:OSX80246.1 hypothetical protein BU14_0056s0029 [Porphyra umbilicalis]